MKNKILKGLVKSRFKQIVGEIPDKKDRLGILSQNHEIGGIEFHPIKKYNDNYKMIIKYTNVLMDLNLDENLNPLTVEFISM